VLALDKICAVVAATDAGAAQEQLHEAFRQTKTVELRLDWLSSDQEIGRFLNWLRTQRLNANLIATCRRRPAGGLFTGSIAKEILHLAEAIAAGCRWYDLEIETSSQCPRELIEILLGEGQRIASAHFFKSLPKNLARVASDLRKNEPDAIKVAAHCDSFADAAKLLGFAQKQKNIIAIPMGEIAMPARFLALRRSSAFAFAPVANATAPGQVNLDEAKKVFRADRIDRQTKVFGVIGDPVGHSLSPAMHNAGFRTRGMNAVYLPFLVRDLKDFIKAVEPLEISGFSVTIPHKESILKYLDGCDPLAAEIGAVNTVVVRGDGKLYGYNTDYVGVLRTLEPRVTLHSSRVLILGAGGAARGVAFALARAGAYVCVTARRMARAKALAKAANGEAIDRKHLSGEFFDAIVNATPVGMYPHVSESPLEARELNCRLVFDTIYRPQKTKLLQLAERRKIETVSGVEMFVAQGAAQWEIWNGERAPVSAMRRAVLEALGLKDKTERAPTRREKRKSTR
jgi:3-dehydroquinate dehydratase/shikimate dehydrogenase